MYQSSFYSTWAMWFLASFFYAFQYVIRVLPNIMMPEIMEKFQIGADIFGQFSGIYYIGYAGLHIPIGLMLDRFGPKKVMPICVLLTVLGVMPLILSDTWVYPVIGRGLIGIGSSAAILGVFKIIRICFAEAKFTRMLGISVTIGLLGAIYGGRPVHYLLNHFGWETVLYVMVSIGILLALAIYCLVPDIQSQKKNRQLLQDIKSVLVNPWIISVCLLAGLMVGPLEGFADVWGTEFLKVVYQMEESQAASLPSLLFLGMCVGAPVLSFIAEKSNAYYSILMLSALIMGISFVYLLTGIMNVYAMSTVFVIIGVLCAYQILSIYKASTYAPGDLTGLATSVANMIIMFFGYFFHSTIGRTIEYFSVNGQYDARAFTSGLSIIPIGLFIGLIGYGIIAILDGKKKIQQKIA